MFDSLSPESAIKLTLKVGAVYKMSAPDLIDTDIPHYFVVVAMDEDDNYLVMSTTQYDNRINYIKRMGWSEHSLGKLEPTKENCFSQTSYFDCNNYHSITTSKLIKKSKSGVLNYEGRISEYEYSIIVGAISYSFTNDIPPDYLNYNSGE